MSNAFESFMADNYTQKLRSIASKRQQWHDGENVVIVFLSQGICTMRHHHTFFLLLPTFLLSACHVPLQTTQADVWPYYSAPDSQLTDEKTSPDSALVLTKPFSRVVIDAPYAVNLIQDPKHPSRVTMKGPDNLDPNLLKGVVKQHTLYLTVPPYQNVPASAIALTISTQNQLDQLVVNGPGDVHVAPFITKRFCLMHHGAGKVRVEGNNLNLYRLENAGDGEVIMTGLNTHDLSVIATPSNSGAITLSGHIGLTELKALGLGAINITGINPTNLSIDANNNAPINLSGQVNLLSLKNSGNGDITINQVVSHNLTIEDSGGANLNLLGKEIGLYRLTSSGRSTINVFDAYSANLSINSNGKGTHINITGQVKLDNLIATGSDVISLMWLFSDKVNAKVSGASTVQLAGIAEEVNATVSGKAHLEARYLRANDGYITTLNDSVASVWMNQKLFAKAQDSSNIYYYYKSPVLAKYTSATGAVLSMTN